MGQYFRVDYTRCSRFPPVLKFSDEKVVGEEVKEVCCATQQQHLPR